MLAGERKQHWDNIYDKKDETAVGWYQDIPETSLTLLRDLDLPLTSAIIDIGGGTSRLVDHLLDLGYTEVSILDISPVAIGMARLRLGQAGEDIDWIVADVTEFDPEKLYDAWHDRAAFHFLTDPAEVLRYTTVAARAIKPGGYLVLGTFSRKGPTTCSGLPIRQYDPDLLVETFSPSFELLGYMYTDHETPAGILQNYLFGIFQRV